MSENNGKNQSNRRNGEISGGRQDSTRQSTGRQGTGRQSDSRAGTGRQGTGRQSDSRAGTGRQGTGRQSDSRAGTGRQGTGRQDAGRQGTGRQGAGRQAAGRQSDSWTNSGRQSSSGKGSGGQSLGGRNPRRASGERQRQNKNRLMIILVLIGLIVLAVIGGFIKESGRKNDAQQSAGGETDSSDAGGSESLQAAATELTMEDEEVRTQIISLIRQYRAACAAADIDTIARLYNTTELRNPTTFMAVATIITGYQNTECYIRPGLDDTSRIVFVYDDLKLADYDTLVPNLSYIYVRAGAGGSFYIDPGTFNEQKMSYEYGEDILKLVDRLENDNEIAALLKSTSEKFSQACEDNAELKAYIEMLTGAAAQGGSESDTQAGESGAGQQSGAQGEMGQDGESGVQSGAPEGQSGESSAEGVTGQSGESSAEGVTGQSGESSAENGTGQGGESGAEGGTGQGGESSAESGTGESGANAGGGVL